MKVFCKIVISTEKVDKQYRYKILYAIIVLVTI